MLLLLRRKMGWGWVWPYRVLSEIHFLRPYVSVITLILRASVRRGIVGRIPLSTRAIQKSRLAARSSALARAIESSGTKTTVIYSDDFCDFVKRHGREAVSRRLNHDALWFVQNYVFPPSHAELLDVRGTYNKKGKMLESGANSDASSYPAEGSELEV